MVYDDVSRVPKTTGEEKAGVRSMWEHKWAKLVPESMRRYLTALLAKQAVQLKLKPIVQAQSPGVKNNSQNRIPVQSSSKTRRLEYFNVECV